MTSINSLKDKKPSPDLSNADKSKKANAVTKTNSENVSYVGSINNNNINNFFIQDPGMLQNLTQQSGANVSNDGVDELKHSKTPSTMPTKELVPQMQKNNYMQPKTASTTTA